MLLIAATVLPVAGIMNDNKTFRETSAIFSNSGQQIIADWEQQAKLIASDGAINDNFGFSVSIDGDYIIAGAPGHDYTKGSVYVFKRDGEPGVKTIWRGFRKLYNYTEMWQLFQPNDLLEEGICG